MPISEVYNMDCMEYMKDIPDKFFDLAIVDRRKNLYRIALLFAR